MTESNDPKSDLRSALERCSKKGGEIGIAVGTFGLIHAGTVRFLRRARAECGCLFAAILSEPAKEPRPGGPSGVASSVSRGADELLRPDERRRVLAAMREVELAGLAGGEGELSLSEWARLAPAARWMFSGAENDVAGEPAAELRRIGVLLREIWTEDDCSTREILDRMRGT